MLKIKLPGLAVCLLLSHLLWPAMAVAAPEHALTFDGVNDYVETNAGVIPTNGSFTIECWAECPVAPGSNRVILSQGSTGSTFFIGTDSANNIRLGDWTPSPAIAFPVGDWHHLALVRSETDAFFFIDGVLKGTRGSALGNPSASTGFRLGRQTGSGGEYWPGSIGDVRIWGRALLSGEVRQPVSGGVTGLLAWWKFDEGEGIMCTSASGVPLSGVMTNGPFWSGNSTLALTSPAVALAFDGVNDYVETGTAVIPSSGDFTVEVWAECPAAPNSYREIISQGGSGNAFYIGTNPSNTIRLGDTWGTLTPAVLMPIGGWHHFALVKSSTNTLFYIDGVLKASRGSAMSNPASSGLRFGRQYGYVDGEFWPGNIGEVRVWSRALLYSEIGNLLGGTEAGLISWWQLHEGAGTTCTSIGSRTIAGVLTNGPAWLRPVLSYTDHGDSIRIEGARPDLAGAFEIPAAINGKPVTSIGPAFLGHTGLTSITIPGSVTHIGSMAFAYTGLTSVTIPASVGVIADEAFRWCPQLASAEFLGDAPNMDARVFDDAASGFTVKFASGARDFTLPTWLGYPAEEVSPELGVQQPAGNPLTDGDATVAFDPVPRTGWSRRTFTLTNAGAGTMTGLALSVSGPHAADFAGSLPATAVAPGGSLEFSITFTPVAAGSRAAVLHIASNDSSQNPFDISLSGEALPLTFTDAGASITITGSAPPPVGALEIPATINGKPVTAIATQAFANFTGLTSVSIPATVTTIAAGAFRGCSELDAILVDEANAAFFSVGGVLFNKARTTLLVWPCHHTGAYAIPATVTGIGDLAFANCTGLWSVSIPPSVTSIGESAFVGCTGLTAVEIPAGVTTIRNSTFRGCSGLVSVTLPSGLTGIESLAFSWCSALVQVTFPAGLSSLGDFAFRDCTALAAAEFLGNAPVPGSNVFYNAAAGFRVKYLSGRTGFTTPTWQGYASVAVSPEIKVEEFFGELIDGVSTVNFGDAPYYVTFSETFTIRNVGTGTLTGLAVSLDGPNAGEFTISGQIPTSLAPGGSAAFVVTFVPDFPPGPRSAAIHIASSDANENPSDFGLAGNALPPYLTISESADSITITGSSPPSFGNLVIPATINGKPVTAIAAGAFSGSGEELFSVRIPAGVTSIGDGAFSGCRGLRSVEFLGGAPAMGTGVFAGAAAAFRVLFHNRATGFTSPVWRGYRSINLEGGTYATWQAGKFSPAEIATGLTTPAADFDSDGHANLLEYAFGGNPKGPDAADVFPVPQGGINAVILFFQCNAACADIIYTVQASSTLAPGSWTDIATSPGGAMVMPLGLLSSTSDSGAGLRTATVIHTSAGARRYLRVQISLP